MGRDNSKRHRRFTDGFGPTGVFIGPEVRVGGELRSDATIDFGGRLEGFLAGAGLVRVRDTARITGNVSAEACVVEGHIKGDLQIRDKVELRANCQVIGDITARIVAIADGAVFEGGITMDGASADQKDVSFAEKREEKAKARSRGVRVK